VFAQLALNAASLGAAYALVALGFVLVLNATAAVNFAHGDLVMAGGLMGAALVPWLPLPAWALLPVTVAVMAGLGLVLSLVAYLPLSRRPPVSVFISTTAVGIILQNGANVLLGAEPRATPPLFGAGSVEIGGVIAGRQDLAILAVAVALIGAQAWVFARTQLGRKLRATAQDPEMARACGIPVRRMVLATFALGAGLAGAAGFLLANRYFMTPASGGDLILKAYIAVTVGGWGSVPGAVAGAVLIAVFEVLVSAALSQPMALAALYAVLLIVLIARPQGLFGEAARRRA
jgi:branched-chain amino acid transport system permease protein